MYHILAWVTIVTIVPAQAILQNDEHKIKPYARHKIMDIIPFARREIRDTYNSQNKIM
jgi:DNA-directed RNA polymerase subunit F